MTTITAKNQTSAQPDTRKSDGETFLAQLRLEPRPTVAPPAAPASAPGNAGSVRIGGSGLHFPMSNFDPEVAPYVAFFDAIYQSLHSDELPMSVGGMSVEEYGLIRNRLERTPQTLEEMDQARQDIEKLVRAINIAGGEGMAIPDNIKKLLEKWKKSERSLSMTQQSTNNGNPLDPINASPIVSPHNPNGPQTGLPSSGNPFGFNASGTSGAQGASGGGSSATEHQLRDLLDKLGANDPSRNVYEILSEVIRNVIDNNAYAHPEKAAAVAEIARILSTVNTGYSNSSIPELLRITESPEAREAHSISIELARMQPDQVTSINQNGEKAVSFLRKANGDYVMQALKPVHLRLPNGETARVEPFQAYSVPRGSFVTVPGMSPVEIGRPPREPTVVYPSDELGLTPRPRPSFDSNTIHRPNPGQSVPPYTPPPQTSQTTTTPPNSTEDFSVPAPNTESVAPNFSESNARWDAAGTFIEVTLRGSLSAEEKAERIAQYILTHLPPEERDLPIRAAELLGRRDLPDDFEIFINKFMTFDFKDPSWRGKSLEKLEKSTPTGSEKLLGRLDRLLESGEKAGWSERTLAVLEKGIQTLATR